MVLCVGGESGDAGDGMQRREIECDTELRIGLAMRRVGGDGTMIANAMLLGSSGISIVENAIEIGV